MSVRVYVGNLPKDIEREELEKVFSDHAEDIVSVKLVTDRKTGRCRGFGFVTMKTDEQADAVVEKFGDYVLRDSALKIEKALPRAKGKEGEESSPAGGSAPKRKGKPSRGKSASSNTSSSEAAQPDPRWAQELEKLKEMLATQATGS
jgi:RNA recognition motif-containing protein